MQALIVPADGCDDGVVVKWIPIAFVGFAGAMFVWGLIVASRDTPRQATVAMPDWLRAVPHAGAMQFEYRGQTVYYVPPGCCDLPGTLYDARGRVLCHPDGGFTGLGDGRCPDFAVQRTNGRPLH